MNEAHLVIVVPVVNAVVQAAKKLGCPSELLPVIAILVGMATGCLLAYAESGLAGISDGAVTGVVGAVSAVGVFASGKSMAGVRARDARGRFTKGA